MADNCSATLPYTARFIKTTWLVGCALSGICYGLLVSLSYISLDALRKREKGNPRVNRFLIGYVLLTILVGTAAEVGDIKGTIDGVFNDNCHSDYLQPPNPYIGHIDIVFLVINLLTDGLLVGYLLLFHHFALTHPTEGVEVLRDCQWASRKSLDPVMAHPFDCLHRDAR